MLNKEKNMRHIISILNALIIFASSNMLFSMQTSPSIDNIAHYTQSPQRNVVQSIASKLSTKHVLLTVNNQQQNLHGNSVTCPTDRIFSSPEVRSDCVLLEHSIRLNLFFAEGHFLYELCIEPYRILKIMHSLQTGSCERIIIIDRIREIDHEYTELLSICDEVTKNNWLLKEACSREDLLKFHQECTYKEQEKKEIEDLKKQYIQEAKKITFKKWHVVYRIFFSIFQISASQQKSFFGRLSLSDDDSLEQTQSLLENAKQFLEEFITDKSPENLHAFFNSSSRDFFNTKASERDCPSK